MTEFTFFQNKIWKNFFAFSFYIILFHFVVKVFISTYSETKLVKSSSKDNFFFVFGQDLFFLKLSECVVFLFVNFTLDTFHIYSWSYKSPVSPVLHTLFGINSGTNKGCLQNLTSLHEGNNTFNCGRFIEQWAWFCWWVSELIGDSLKN